MPFATEAKARPSGTGRGCRAVVAAGMLDPGSEWTVFRALQIANFTGSVYLDDAESIREALRDGAGRRRGPHRRSPRRRRRRRRVRAPAAEARSAAGTPAEAQDKTATSRRARAVHRAVRRVPSWGGRARSPAAGSRSSPTTRCLRTSLPSSSAFRRPDSPEPLLDVLPGGPDDGRGRAAARGGLRSDSRMATQRSACCSNSSQSGARVNVRPSVAARSGAARSLAPAENGVPSEAPRTLGAAMLVEDTSAFIEQLEVAEAGRRAAKRRRRVTQAGSRSCGSSGRWASRPTRWARWSDSCAEIDLATGCIGRGLLRDRRARSLEREIAATRKRLQAKRADLDAKRQRLSALEQRTEQLDSARRAKLFRLHSSKHHLECSERRFARIARSQSDLPILVGRQDGRRWWWFRDRFWWDDQGSRRPRTCGRSSSRRISTGSNGPTRSPRRARPSSASTWRPRRCRLRPRSCASRCGAATKGAAPTAARARSVAFDRILPFDEGGSDAPPNIELRCEPCKERRVANEARARVARAQVAAATYYR